MNLMGRYLLKLIFLIQLQEASPLIVQEVSTYLWHTLCKSTVIILFDL